MLRLLKPLSLGGGPVEKDQPWVSCRTSLGGPAQDLPKFQSLVWPQEVFRYVQFTHLMVNLKCRWKKNYPFITNRCPIVAPAEVTSDWLMTDSWLAHYWPCMPYYASAVGRLSVLTKSIYIRPHMPSLVEIFHQEPTPLGALNIEMFCANKMPRLTCYFELCFQKSELCIWNIWSMPNWSYTCQKEACKASINDSKPRASFGLLKGCWSPSNELLANWYQITACYCETIFISYATFEAWALFPCMSGRCPWSIGVCFHPHVGR